MIWVTLKAIDEERRIKVPFGTPIPRPGDVIELSEKVGDYYEMTLYLVQFPPRHIWVDGLIEERGIEITIQVLKDPDVPN